MRSRFLLFIPLQFVLIPMAFTQITFQKTYSTSSSGKPTVYLSADGGYILGGRSLVKTNEYGDTLWTRSYYFGSSAVNCFTPTYDGGYAVAGHTHSFGQGNTDSFIGKIDSIGNIEWSKTYGGITAEEAHSIVQTADSGFVIAGKSRSLVNGGMETYLVKTDVNGNILWTVKVAGSGDDYASSLIKTTDGSLVVAGTIGLMDTSGSYDPSAYISKLDNNGNILWTHTYDVPGSCVVGGVRQTSDGGYVLTGTAFYFSSSSIVDLFILKADSSGNMMWSHFFNHEFSFGNAIEQTGDGGYIIAGQLGPPSASNEVCLIKTDANGDTMWTRTYGGADTDGGFSVKQTNDGGYIVAGATTSFGNGYYLIKTDSMGYSGCNESTIPSFTITDTLVADSAIPATFITYGTSMPFAGLSSNLATVVPVCSSVTGLTEAGIDNGMIIHPNPFTDRFKITLSNPLMNGVCRIYDVRGRCVFEDGMFNSSEKEIHLPDVAPGMYLLRISDESGADLSVSVVTIR
jgi:hypothetical protein